MPVFVKLALASKRDRIKSLSAQNLRHVTDDGSERSTIQRGFGDYALAPKLTTIFSGLSQLELSLFAKPVTTLNLPGGAGRYAIAKRILAKGKKIPWAKCLREMHVASLNVFVGLTDDPPINKSGEKVGGALTQDICSKFRDLLGVYSNDTVFGRRFLVAADTRPRSATFTSSDGFIILNFPEDDFNAIDVSGHHNIVGNRGSRLRLNITFRTLDFSPRLPKLFQFLTRNLVISELHVVILTTKKIAESLIRDASGITWIQLMKNLAITEHFFLRVVFLSQCETCEFCKDEEMNDLIHKLVPQLRKALLPSSTWKDLRANEKLISSQ
ncbi:hypothetical protein HYALB_00007949 [Hymenoscyphus albidus]|uniref:Uncharacterized protein n=1 Tax=Hymenoscyphus albidus TaxID=595503 RepID=A0A9N9LMX3_9HELO|nr:hypothetical protein HYALB_00007949 [Hymenoscyphus albidus]